MKFDNFKRDQGVAGLTILLSLLTTLFVIGLIVMVFALMGGELMDVDSVVAGESATATDTSITVSSASFTLTDCDNANQGAITSLTDVQNETIGAVELANFTYSGCVVSIVDGVWNATTYDNATYTYSYAGSSWDVINDTTDSISSVTDWYPIFIVIGAMVVLVLLTVIIITAIKNSGLMVGSGKGSGTLGSA